MSQPLEFAHVCVRRARPEDRARIREICQQTALRGLPTRSFFEDEEVVSRLFADYYLDYEPESCFVAEVDGQVVGYALACKDTRRYLRVMATRIVPRVMGRILWKILTLGYRRRSTYQTLWWVVARSWRELPTASLTAYPAHLHANLDPAVAEMKLVAFRLGMKLAEAVIAHLREAGVRGIQGAIAEPEDDENLSLFYRRIYGARVTDVRRFSLWEMFTDRRWYAKMVVIDLATDTASGKRPPELLSRREDSTT
jgi:hypothetical protein